MFLNTNEPKKSQPNDTIREKNSVKEECNKNQVTKVTSPINTLSQSHNYESNIDHPIGSYSRHQQSQSNSPSVSSTHEDIISENKIKMESKLLTIWHNVKYGWKGKINANFSKEQPVWLLGICYHQKYSQIPPNEPTDSMSSTSSSQHTDSLTVGDFDYIEGSEIGTDVIGGSGSDSAWANDGIEGFKKDFISRIWMTYRREFQLMTDSKYTSDCGWGCMLRSGQMMLAQALVCHFLGRSWRYDTDTQLFSTQEDYLHRKILRWFGDSSSKNCPFSIHTLVKLGAEAGKKPGDWYGPGAVSHLLKQAVKIASHENIDLDGLNVYVAQDSTIFLADLLDECLVSDQATQRLAPWQQQNLKLCDGIDEQRKYWKPLVLLIPVRLGADKLNPDYENNLKAFLTTEYCIGIIGGRPKHSLYFVGFQEDKLIHLDPHYCQEMVDINDEKFSLNSFHCRSPRKIKFSKMDPSCCIGFYCRTRDDLDNLIANVQPYLTTGRMSTQKNYPMFTFHNGRSSDHAFTSSTTSIQSGHTPNHSAYNTTDDDESETEEFIII